MDTVSSASLPALNASNSTLIPKSVMGAQKASLFLSASIDARTVGKEQRLAKPIQLKLVFTVISMRVRKINVLALVWWRTVQNVNIELVRRGVRYVEIK